MFVEHEECLRRASQARQEAERASLPHVRDRHLRSASMWEDLAERAARREQFRAREETRRLAKITAATDKFYTRPPARGSKRRADA